MGDIVDKDKDETSNTLLMFGHFVLPPSHHQNMPSGPENAQVFYHHVGKRGVISKEGGDLHYFINMADIHM